MSLPRENEDLTTPSSQRAHRLPLPPGMIPLRRVMAVSNQRRPRPDLLAMAPEKFPHGVFFAGPGGCTWVPRRTP